MRDEGRTISVAERRDGERRRGPVAADGLEVVHHSLTVTIGNRFGEEDEVRELPVDCDDGRVGGGHQHEFRADIVTNELAQSFRFGRFRFDG